MFFSGEITICQDFFPFCSLNLSIEFLTNFKGDIPFFLISQWILGIFQCLVIFIFPSSHDLPPHSSNFLASLRDFSNISSGFPMNFPWFSGFPMNFPLIFHGFRQTTHIAGLPHRWRAAGERPHGGTLAAAATRGMGPWRPWGTWGPGSWWYTVDICGYTIQLYIYICISNLI